MVEFVTRVTHVKVMDVAAISNRSFGSSDTRAVVGLATASGDVESVIGTL